MPTHAGPNTTGEGNIVFSYDTGDTSNSYRGEPTTNLYTTLGFGFYQQEGNHTAARTVGPAPNLNLPSNYDYTTITTTGNWQAEVNRIIIWTNSSLSIGTYNISFWARVTSTTTATMGCAFYGNGINHTMSLTNQWQRFSIKSTTHPTYRATEFGSLSGAITFQIAGLQIESISHAAQYVNGVRSATQGLLPLVGNSTIDLSNVSFNSNAQITFDGTDDYVNLGSYLHNIDTSTLSIEIVFKTNVVTGNALILLGWHENEYPHGYICLGNFTGHWGNETISFYNEGPGTTALSFAYTNGHSLLSDTLYHHVVFILQTNNYKIYIDGVEVAVNASFRNGSQSTVMPSNLFGYGTTPSVVLGAGSDPASGFFNGNITITKIYNRALTAQEVKQNYQQYKSRFNLS